MRFVASADSIGILFGKEAAQKSSDAEAFVDLGQTVSALYQKYEGDKLAVTRRSFNVRVVLKVVGSGVVSVDQMVFISTSAANTFFSRSNRYDGIYVITGDPELNSGVQRLIRGRYGTDVSLVSPQTIADTINQKVWCIPFHLYYGLRFASGDLSRNHHYLAYIDGGAHQGNWAFQGTWI